MPAYKLTIEINEDKNVFRAKCEDQEGVGADWFQSAVVVLSKVNEHGIKPTSEPTPAPAPAPVQPVPPPTPATKPEPTKPEPTKPEAKP